jgi:hypothetical protein
MHLLAFVIELLELGYCICPYTLHAETDQTDVFQVVELDARPQRAPVHDVNLSELYFDRKCSCVSLGHGFLISQKYDSKQSCTLFPYLISGMYSIHVILVQPFAGHAL